MPDELEGQKVDAVVFHVRAVNKEGTSEWSTAQAADERIQLPALSYHLRLCGENTSVPDDEGKIALYEIVIDNKDDFTSITAGDRELTVTATYSSADSDEEKSQSSAVKIWMGRDRIYCSYKQRDELLLIAACHVRVIRALPIQKKHLTC